MQRVSVINLKPGMIVARNIFNAEGVMLLNAGMILCDTYIDRLNQLGIHSIYIENPLLKDIEIPEVIREETRVKAVAMVHKGFEGFRKSARIHVKQFQQAADCIVNEILTNDHAMVHLTDIRSHDNYTFCHSVNVAVLATITARQLGYTTTSLRALALGALLHDIGKSMIPLDILNKPERLNDGEMQIMKRHSELGFDILRHQIDQIPLLAAHVAFQHHEKFNGKGYPRSLCGTKIHEYARITAIADVYDAITADRPYRGPIPPHEAYEILMLLSGTHFDPDILNIFLENIAAYPIGSFVVLNTGEIGIVLNVIPKLPSRPTIRIIADAKGNLLHKYYDISLTEKLTAFITNVLSETEVIEKNLKISPDVASIAQC